MKRIPLTRYPVPIEVEAAVTDCLTASQILQSEGRDSNKTTVPPHLQLDCKSWTCSSKVAVVMVSGGVKNSP